MYTHFLFLHYNGSHCYNSLFIIYKFMFGYQRCSCIAFLHVFLIFVCLFTNSLRILFRKINCEQLQHILQHSFTKLQPTGLRSVVLFRGRRCKKLVAQSCLFLQALGVKSHPNIWIERGSRPWAFPFILHICVDFTHLNYKLYVGSTVCISSLFKLLYPSHRRIEYFAKQLFKMYIYCW